MKTFWNLLVLGIFLNFMALPSIATLFGCNLNQTTIIVSEEENHSNGFTFYEETLGHPIQIHTFINFLKESNPKKGFTYYNESIHLSHYLAVFSPPPEF